MCAAGRVVGRQGEASLTCAGASQMQGMRFVRTVIESGLVKDFLQQRHMIDCPSLRSSHGRQFVRWFVHSYLLHTER